MIGKPDPVFPIVNNNVYDDYYDQNDEEEGALFAQGRFIVHARGMKEHTFHEIQVDFQNGQYDKNQNHFIKRGSFRDVEDSITDYAKQGVTALYVMGTLERDNYAFLNKYSDQVQYRKDDASPLAVTTRDSANKMLGGDHAFSCVVQKAK